MTSPSSVKIRNSATKVSSDGNIWMSNRVIRPGRRPWNRSREKAYAAHTPMNTAAIEPIPAMMRVFLYQDQNGREAVRSV
ncbi:MAG: hypothetical protein BWY91_03172 [bacterium ADurb.BinA028]|nr:MAG: hypothetical protein BWY91_03172 [bacterium ADurb.BinA028]